MARVVGTDSRFEQPPLQANPGTEQVVDPVVRGCVPVN